MTSPRSSGEPKIHCLARLFRNTTNSYKYLFFLALLDLLGEKQERASVRFAEREVAVGMLARAWHPYFLFRLSFGASDQIPRFLERIPLRDTRLRKGSVVASLNLVKRELSDSLPLAIEREMLRYVPTRILRVFFEDMVGSGPDWAVDQKIRDLARSEFETVVPLFKIDGSEIVMSEAWSGYLRNNLEIVRDWAMWEWLRFMQARNPNTPSIATKLLPMIERRPLVGERKLWRMVLERADLRCIYSGGELKEFAMDHFLPWSFVAHDRMWNLIPCYPAANSSKGDRVPRERYLPVLVRNHVAALRVWRQMLSDQAWKKWTEAYVADLNVPFEVLQSEEKRSLESQLLEAYRRTVLPLMGLAGQQRFPTNWEYAVAGE